MKPTEHLTITERPGTYIVVMSDSRGPIIVVSDGPGARAYRYTPEEAAKLGLAILEAAGYSDEYEGGNCWAGPLGQAMHMLRLEAEAQERATTEARERAKLEAEALELFRASQCIRTDGMYASVPSFAALSDPSKTKWLAVARRAREIAGRAEK